MINRVVLVGRITKDPMLRKTQSGVSVVSFTIACNRRVPSQGQDADFINCVAWNKTADFMAQYVKKVLCWGLKAESKRAATTIKTENVFMLLRLLRTAFSSWKAKKQLRNTEAIHRRSRCSRIWVIHQISLLQTALTQIFKCGYIRYRK